MLSDMPFASTVIVAAPSTRILWPLAVKRIVGSPDWKRIPLYLAAIVLMMVLVQPVSGVARTWDHFPSVLVSQSSSFGVPASDLSALASWIVGSSSSSPAFSVVATLALSLFFCEMLLSRFDLQIFARCPVHLHFVHLRDSLFSLHSIDLCPSRHTRSM